jgi:hypothetical protein
MGLSPRLGFAFMDDAVSNDNNFPSVAPRKEPDAHGQAAMLLVESLIHGLIARSVLTVAQAVEIVEVATDVKLEIAADEEHSQAGVEKSLDLLKSISASLMLDLPRS